MAQIAFIGRIASITKNDTQTGKKRLTLRVAENHRRQNKAGAWEEVGTTWHTVELWEAAAVAAADRFTEKDLVQVVGQQVSRAFTTKEGANSQFTHITGASLGFIAHAKTGDDETSWLMPEEDREGEATK